MSDFLTDEEKAEKIKEWFKENGIALVLGITLAFGGIFGMRYWQDHQRVQSEEGSALYSQVQQESISKADTLYSKVAQLKSDYTSTPYAALGALLAAKQHAANGDNAKAITELKWVVDNAEQKVTQDLAKIRLARVYVANKQYDEASTILNGELPEAYASLVEELKGDIHLAKNEIEKAREAYDKALLSAKGASTEYLKMKRDDLGKGT